jgi:hypothetical protein
MVIEKLCVFCGYGLGCIMSILGKKSLHFREKKCPFCDEKAKWPGEEKSC